MQEKAFIRATEFRLSFLFYADRQNQQNAKNNIQKIILKKSKKNEILLKYLVFCYSGFFASTLFIEKPRPEKRLSYSVITFAAKISAGVSSL